MTYLGGSVAYLWSQLNLWTGRANQAWGASRVWNNGASWETNYTNQLAAYNSLLGTYNSLVSQYNTLLGNYNQAVADRDAWIGYAHSDPNVWTNRYNAGYGQASADLAIAGSGQQSYYCQATDCSNGFGGGNGGWSTVSLGGQSQSGYTFFVSGNQINAPVTGLYAVHGNCRAHAQNGGQQAGFRMIRNGNPNVSQWIGTSTAESRPDAGFSTGSFAMMGFGCLVVLGAGESIQFQGYQSWGVDTVQMWMSFLPTPSYKR